MWSRADILGLFSLNVVSFSRNVVLRVLLFSLNSVLKPRMLSVRADYVLSSLQVGTLQASVSHIRAKREHMARDSIPSIRRCLQRFDSEAMPQIV